MISNITHPEYTEKLWQKYRLTYKGGEAFKQKFLIERTNEEEKDFDNRLRLTYPPA